MNARFAHVLSRLSIVSVVAVSALGATACNTAVEAPAELPPPDDPPPPAPLPPPARRAERPERAPGQQIFGQVEALDLRDEQRAAVSEVRQNLIADLAPHREAMRQVAETLAKGIETGRLEASDAAAQQAALAVAVTEAKASFGNAMNAIHDTLDPDQRAALVARLEEQRLAHAQGRTGEHGPLAKLALEIGLSDEQKAALHEAVQKSVEDFFPDHKTRREAQEAKLQAMGDAFVSDDFDAADFNLGGGAERAMESFGQVATRAIAISGSVLSDSQRQMAATMLRSHAARF